MVHVIHNKIHIYCKTACQLSPLVISDPQVVYQKHILYSMKKLRMTVTSSNIIPSLFIIVPWSRLCIGCIICQHFRCKLQSKPCTSTQTQGQHWVLANLFLYPDNSHISSSVLYPYFCPIKPNNQPMIADTWLIRAKNSLHGQSWSTW